MKFDCGPTYDKRIAARKEWHDWFAWYPIRLRSADCAPSSDGGGWVEFSDSRECRWLEVIQRRGHLLPTGEMWMPEWHYEYRDRA